MAHQDQVGVEGWSGPRSLARTGGSEQGEEGGLQIRGTVVVGGGGRDGGRPVQHEEVTQGEVEVLRGVTAAVMATAAGINPTGLFEIE